MKVVINYLSTLLLCFSVILFMKKVDYLYSLRLYAILQRIVLPLMIILITGLGTNIALRQMSSKATSFTYAFVYSVMFLLLQFFLLFMPAMSSCGCVSIKQILNNIEPDMMFTTASISFIYHLIIFSFA